MKAILGESFGGYQELEFSKHPLSLRKKILYSKFSWSVFNPNVGKYGNFLRSVSLLF